MSTSPAGPSVQCDLCRKGVARDTDQASGEKIHPVSGGRWVLCEDQPAKSGAETVCQTEDDHEWEFKQDMIGDPEVVNGTMNLCWRECIHCGKQAEARPEDFDDGSDYE